MIKEDVIQKILQEYDTKHSLYSAFTSKQEHLIAEVLLEHSLSPHSITSRVKCRQNLHDKLRKADAEYTQLSDVTDISGVRITTYFNDEVDKVASFLDKEFQIVKEHSIDKRKLLDADRFGYLSLHQVVSLSSERLKLTEYKRFPKLFCEIQVRSILQHAWAEIEHDLGYKTRIAVPQALRRRFSRLAGLLELADEEFMTIRDALASYREALPAEIKKSPASITLDKLSLSQFLKSNSTAQELDSKIASFMDGKLVEQDEGENESLEAHLSGMNLLGFETLSDLERVLSEKKLMILSFAKTWIGFNKHKGVINPGICLFYLGYVIVAETRNTDYALRFLNAETVGVQFHDEIIKKLFKVFESIK